MSDEEKDIRTHRERLPLVDKEKQAKEIVSREKQRKEDLAIAFSTPQGREALRFIQDLCGWGKTCVGGNAAMGMDIKDGTLYNAARQSIYLELRARLPARLLKIVEFHVQEIKEEII